MLAMMRVCFLTWALAIVAVSGSSFKSHAESIQHALMPYDAGSTSTMPHSGSTRTARKGMEHEAVERVVIDEISRMQSHFFSQSAGIWPDANDWTSSVVQTYVAGAMKQLSIGNIPTPREGFEEGEAMIENTLNGHFVHLVAFYYGQDALGIMQQAHDDMLWLILGWLELIRTTQVHSTLYWDRPWQPDYGTDWHGTQYISSFAHRSRIFYDIVHRAWDTELCGGGLTWDPKLEPYKNTVTNTLFISAAIDMYLYHPGDNDTGPYQHATSTPAGRNGADEKDADTTKPHDPNLLQRAIEAHDWLQAVNLRDSNGLYVDGYHISPENRRHPSTPDQCDVRNEMLYTYNQGIILSGLRGLWDATGNKSYLIEGHELIQNVIGATGWDGKMHIPDHPSRQDNNLLMEILGYLVNSDSWIDTSSPIPDEAPEWYPLGRGGILHEFCDANGDCSQDAQTFKGIFFHHLAKFCKPLPQYPSEIEFVPGISHVGDMESRLFHGSGCAEYAQWVFNNARAAYMTRNEDGIMGGWWGVDIGDNDADDSPSQRPLPDGAIDVVNLQDGSMRRPTGSQSGQTVMEHSTASDANDRGRGRTLETHASGVAVLRCLLEMMPYLFDDSQSVDR